MSWPASRMAPRICACFWMLRPKGPRSSAILVGMHSQPLSPVLGRYYEREWTHGKGHRLYDGDGNSYLDFANGIAVTSLGHQHPRVTAALHARSTSCCTSATVSATWSP